MNEPAPSAATLAAKQEYETALHAAWDVEHVATNVDPDQLAVIKAVAKMADARYMICAHTDALVAATQEHNEALRTLKAFNPSLEA